MLELKLSPALYGANVSVRSDEVTTAYVPIPRDLVVNNVIYVPGKSPGSTFVLPVPLAALRDPSIRILTGYELGFSGYESPTRLFLRDLLCEGDLFLDVGAHWGLFALDLASNVPGVNVVAVEPIVPNLRQLQIGIQVNHLEPHVAVVAAAAGASPGRASMMLGISMTHQVTADANTGRRSVTVPITTLDEITDRVHLAQDARVVAKIDVEGQELAVLEGAQRLLASGRLAAVVWEYHDRYHTRGNPSGEAQIRRMLEAAGFNLYRFAHHHWGGALIPFAGGPGVCNVIAIPATSTVRTTYRTAAASFPPLPPPYYDDFDDSARSAGTRRLRSMRGADAVRWADPANLDMGALVRARLARRFIFEGARILDVGAGSGMLTRVAPDCEYLALDLLEHAPGTQLCDVDSNGIPAADGGVWDVVAALDVLPYLYDPVAFLRDARKRGKRLLLTYPIKGTGTDAERLVAGWRQDWTKPDLDRELNAAGWTIIDEAEEGKEKVLCCEGTSGVQ